MRIVQVGPRGEERPGVLIDDEHYVDVSDTVASIDGAFLSAGGLEMLRALLGAREPDDDVRALDGVRLGAPIARPHQILCIGLNYRDHAKETGQAIPAEPIVFTKAPNTLVGPTDDLVIPRGSTKTDWEVELGVVIGRQASYLDSDEQALEAVAGYVAVNDVSEREFQIERGGQWTKGKSCATFNPCGPWLATPDELGDIGSLAMWLDVNRQARQRGNTATMLFGVAAVIRYLSQFMVLEPGDLINTGTPPGVGMGMDPPTYLRAGDVVELGIDGLGTQRQTVANWEGEHD